jgi:hypothetical protein
MQFSFLFLFGLKISNGEFHLEAPASLNSLLFVAFAWTGLKKQQFHV